MSSIKKRGNNWRCTVDFKKVRASKTFKDKKSAEIWGATTEAEILHGLNDTMDHSKTFEDLLIEYQKNVTPTKRMQTQKTEAALCKKFKRLSLSKIYLKDLNATHFVDYRDTRLKTVLGSTVNREFNLISAVLTYGIKEKRWIKTNPVSEITRPKNPKPRTRRLSESEIANLNIAFGYSDDSEVLSRREQTGVLMNLAIETAMRKSEMLNLLWVDVHDKYVHLDTTKNGSERDVPLSNRARLLISKMRDIDTKKVFTVSANSVDFYWMEAKNKCDIKDLHFHDTRREATTRLSQKVDVMKLAKITGHKDVNMLLNVYYKPTPDSLADLLD